MYCPRCGTPLPEDALFCGGCGEAVAELPALELQSEQAASEAPSSVTYTDKKKLPIGVIIPAVLLAIIVAFGIAHITSQTSNVSDQLQGDWRSGGTSGQLISFSPDGTCDLSVLGENFAEMESWKILPGETLKLESSSGTSMYISRSKSETFPEQNALAPARIDTGLYCLVDDRLLIGATEFHAGKGYWNAGSASPQTSAVNTDDENSAGLQSPQSTTPAKPIIPSTEHALSVLEDKSYPPANVVDLDDDYHFVCTADGYVVGLCYKRNFLVHDGRFIPIAWGAADEDYSFEDYRPYPQNLLPPERYEYLCNASKPEESRILVIDKAAGDEIATFWDSEERNFLPYEGGVYSIDEYRTSFGTADSLIEWYFSDAEEVDGMAIANPNEAVDILKAKGIYISIPSHNGSKAGYDFCCDEPTSFIIGKYQGTKFVEDRIELNSWRPFYGQGYPAPTVKTKDGYFLVDYSGIPAGIYSFGNGLVRIVESDDDSQSRAIENLTWAELAELSDQISACESQEAAFELAAQFGLCSEDGAIGGSQFKLVALSDGTTAIAQIVGIYHDDKTGGGKAGLSFLLKNSFTERALVDDWKDNSGWKTCSMRSWLNDDVFAMLPSDLQQAIVPVDKMANNSGGGYASASAVSMVSDRLWLPSCIELFGVNQDDNSEAINSEGYQYELYSGSGLNWSGGNIVNKNLNGKDSYGAISGVQNIWWTRTPSPATECYWIRIQNGIPVTDYGSIEEGVAFGFCLGTSNPSSSDPQISQAAFVQDNYGVLTSDEAASFEQQAQSIAEQYQIGVYLVTVADIGDQSARSFAIDYYTQNDLGVGSMRSGVMLLIAVESRDFVTITHGDGGGSSEIGEAGAVDTFTDKRLDSIENNLAVYLKSDNWVKAAESFFDDSQETIEYLFVVGKPI